MDRRHVLVTGAFGNIGTHTLRALLAQGHVVSCFDAATPVNKRTAREFKGECQILWGDVRELVDLRTALNGVDEVIHLAGIIPPLSEVDSELAHAVNVDGTRNLLRVMNQNGGCRRIVFSSSMAVHGKDQGREPPLRVSDPYSPDDHYSQHKVACERAVLESGLDWTILRLAACPTPNVSSGLKNVATMFEMGLGARLEFCHPADVGLACANAVNNQGVVGKILFIGGGKRCRYEGYEFVTRSLEAIGVGPLPASAFSTSDDFYGDWVDTEESEALLRYQRHQLSHWLDQVKEELGAKRLLAKLFAPIVRRQLLRRSPYYSPGNGGGR